MSDREKSIPRLAQTGEEIPSGQNRDSESLGGMHVHLEENDRGIGPVEDRLSAAEDKQLGTLHVALDEGRLGNRAVRDQTIQEALLAGVRARLAVHAPVGPVRETGLHRIG